VKRVFVDVSSPMTFSGVRFLFKSGEASVTEHIFLTIHAFVSLLCFTCLVLELGDVCDLLVLTKGTCC